MAAPSIVHITTVGERWDLIAWNYYGDPTLYSAIILANNSIPISPVLPAGTQLLIPLLQVSPAQTVNLPPWKTAS
ncbi:MAG TPA: tail protein X [Candidatus Binataceae bacterium]|nr:tail protein X [Candidatus Binataceae bacterium]